MTSPAVPLGTVTAMESSESRTWYIYCHTAPNGKRYIGQTRTDPEVRWGKGRGYSSQQYFKRAIDKYGWDNIEHAVLCSVSNQEYANFLEQWFIEKWDTTNPSKGYNCSKGGAGPTGVTWDDERKQAFSEYMTGENNPMYGRSHSEETRARISEKLCGRKLSPEDRAYRTSIILAANKRRQTPIRQLDMDGNEVATYPSFSAATKATGYNHSSLCNCCLGKIDTAYGYKWEYVDEEKRRLADERRKREDMRRFNEPSNNLWVIQCDLDGNEIARFKSMAEASRATGVKRHVIADCCHGGLGSYGDYGWRFAGNNAKPDRGMPVMQLDLDGNEIARFDSLDDACAATGFHRSALLNCCKGRSSKSYGYLWRFIGEEPPSNRIGARSAVTQLDLDGNEIANYSSLADAMKATGCDRHRIVECCNGLRESYRDYRWQYSDKTQTTANQPDNGLFY